jgi:hypothetical protein
VGNSSFTVTGDQLKLYSNLWATHAFKVTGGQLKLFTNRFSLSSDPMDVKPKPRGLSAESTYGTMPFSSRISETNNVKKERDI